MADLEFYFDPVCPFAWITSRWVTEVQQLRDYEVTWKFISLKFINQDRTDDWYTPEYRAAHMAGLYAHRVCDEVRLRHDNAAVAALYTAIGTAFHPNQRRKEMSADPEPFMVEMLTTAGLSAAYAVEVHNEAHDEYIRQSTEEAFSRTGRDVGTPILTYRPGTDTEASLFGPVISRTPRGEEALRLWDAVEVLAGSGVAEIKRSLRAPLDFT